LIEQSPKAAITQSIAGLATALFNEGKPEAAAGKKSSGLGGLFSRWSGKGK